MLTLRAFVHPTPRCRQRPNLKQAMNPDFKLHFKLNWTWLDSEKGDQPESRWPRSWMSVQGHTVAMGHRRGGGVTAVTAGHCGAGGSAGQV